MNVRQREVTAMIRRPAEPVRTPPLAMNQSHTDRYRQNDEPINLVELLE